MKSHRKIDPVTYYLQAERFMRADIYLRSSKDPNIMNAVGIPAMVISAFASELFMKSLFILERDAFPPPTHDLFKLFRKLAPGTQQLMHKLWDTSCQQHQEKTMREAIEKHTGQKIDISLEAALADGAEGFIKLRYIHEQKNNDTKFMIANLSMILKEAILELYPYFRAIDLPRPTDLRAAHGESPPGLSS